MLKKIIRYIKIFSSSTYVFKLPKKKRVLIYDPNEQLIKSISSYLINAETGCMHVRGEFFNIPIFLISLLSSNFFQLKKNYIVTYLNFAKPEVVLTSTDNDMVFYTLKEIFKKKITFIVLQNGLRGIYDNFKEFKDYNLNKKNKLQVDYFLTINTSVIRKYQKYIKANYISIGLIANNLVKINKVKKKNQILFISQFKNSIFNNGFKLNNVKKIKGNVFFKADKIVLDYLLTFIKKNKRYTLVICLRPGSNYLIQKKLILDILKIKKRINFFIPKKKFDTYREVDKSLYVTCVDSALGYEAYARGSIVGFFSIRGKYIDHNGTDFAWPAKLKKKNFWTNKYSHVNFNKVMKYISKNKKDYNLYRVKNRVKIMDYDKGNSKFVKLLRLLKAPLKSNIIKNFQINYSMRKKNF